MSFEGNMIICEPSEDMGKRLEVSGITRSFPGLGTLKKSNSLMLRHHRASLLCCGLREVSHFKFAFSATTFVRFPSTYVRVSILHQKVPFTWYAIQLQYPRTPVMRSELV